MKTAWNFLFGVVLISFTGFAQSPETQLKVDFKNVEENTPVYLYKTSADGSQFLPLDTLLVKNGKISYKFPHVDFQEINALRIDDMQETVYYFNENQPVVIKVDQEDITNATVEGGESTTLFTKYQSLNNKKSEKEILAFKQEAVKNHPNALASAYIFSEILQKEEMSKEELEDIFDHFSEEVKKSSIGKQIERTLHPTGPPEVGDIAPNFSALTPEGEELSLKDMLDKGGKYIIIEFWASWCPHCQQEMPRIAEIYKEYHDQGLEIIGISVDDNKNEWEQGIKDLGMQWEQISNLKKWNEPIALQYGIRSIPYNFIVDSQGKIVALHLNGKELKDKIQKLFNE